MYQQLWDLITLRRIDFLVAKEISRLNRSLLDFCALMAHCKENGVSVHIKNLDINFDSPMGEFLYKLLALLAEFERTLIIQRTKSGIRAGQLRGKIQGGPIMLGFDKGESESGWIVNESEIAILDRLLDIVLEHDSFKSVCEALTAEGITPKYGTEFRSDSVKRLVRNRKLEGILEIKDGDKVVEKRLDFGAVVDLAKLELARRKVVELEEKFSKKTRRRKRNNLLTGFSFL